MFSIHAQLDQIDLLYIFIYAQLDQTDVFWYISTVKSTRCFFVYMHKTIGYDWIPFVKENHLTHH